LNLLSAENFTKDSWTSLFKNAEFGPIRFLRWYCHLSSSGDSSRNDPYSMGQPSTPPYWSDDDIANFLTSCILHKERSCNSCLYLL